MTAEVSLVDRIWYGRSHWRWPLMPFSGLFWLLSTARRKLYDNGIWHAVDIGQPVLVVGNITVGGTGKTPVTLWLAERLKDYGMRPGIVSRGYRGRLGPQPVRVMPDSDPAIVGDEALLMERRQICPVVVHPDRVAAARLLLQLDCNVIIADDGLQHFRLERLHEIAVLDGTRGFGNGCLLPAGPLRESVARLSSVDRIFIQQETERNLMPAGFPDNVPKANFELVPAGVLNLVDSRRVSLEHFRGRAVHAVAAIGNPGRFFRLLQKHGIDVIPHAHRDHAKLTASDLRFDDGLDVLMTEKDAVKVRGAATNNCWYVKVDVQFTDGDTLEWLEEVYREMSGREATIGA
ncbi:MAG: tetraacyldisaccharide 4'-kinase [Woeseia sp.]